jgi:Uma2 family endonuclease
MSVTHESWPRPHRLTVDEYYRMAEVGLLPPDARVELIEGEIIDMAPIGSRHARTVDYLAKRLILAVGEAATVLIEVSDATLRFDREVKARLYAKHRVPELWIVDLNNERLHVFRNPVQDAYADRSTVKAGVMNLPTLAIGVDLTSLF